MEKNNKPLIRFKNFSENWQEFKLGSIGDPYTGLSGKTKKDFGHGEGKYVTYMNVFSNPVSDLDTIEKIEIDSTQNEVISGDVLFTVSSETPEEVGMSSVWTGNSKNIYLNSFCFGYRPRYKFNNYFLANLLRAPSFRKKITFLAQGISRYNISKNKVMELCINFPGYEEQKVIGYYFEYLENIINEHKKLHNKLISLKKAMLSKLFPEKGQTLPQIRFKGFTNKWNEKKLSEFSTYHSSTLSVGNALGKGKYKLFDANEMIGYTNENGQPCEYISIIKDGSGVGRVRLMQQDTSFIGTMGAIRAFESDINFLYCCLLKTDFNKYITGATIPHIYYSNYSEEKIFIPSKEEQIKIGNYFKNIDILVSNHEIQIDKLIKIKKAFLAKMFI